MSAEIRTGTALAVCPLLLVSVAAVWAAAPATAHKAHDHTVETVIERVVEPAVAGEAQSHAQSVLAPAAAATTEPAAMPATSSEADVVPDRPASNVPQPLAWLGRFHPPLTHFPIALLIAAAVAELLFIRTGGTSFDHAMRFCVRFGAVGALAAAPLGWLFAGFHFVDDEWLMTAHRWAGTATALLAVALVLLCERAGSGSESRKSFRVALFSVATLVAATGFLGGSLLYGLDHFAWWVTQ